MITIYHWVVFNIIILSLLFLDLWHAKRAPHAIGIKEALLTSAGWIGLALLFNLWIYQYLGKEAALAFLTGYLLEESLSIDNLFVFLLIFSHFKVPDHMKHKVLFYGILGAIFMRAALILGGLAFIHLFTWAFYLFGAFLIYTGINLAFKKETKIRHEETLVYRLFSAWIPFTSDFQGEAFLIKKEGKWMGTPLLIILILIEITDLIFAFDSVPAILGITTDPFIVYTSNIFAILGLRSLFFVLEGFMQRFYLLHYALALILVFIGCKMILMDVIHIPIWLTLGILLALILIALLTSWLIPPKQPLV